MTDNMFDLLNKFNEITEKSWIKGVNNTLSGVGMTFENELGKKPDSDPFPDFKDIEIKCSQRFSNYPLRLFGQAFDGPHLFEVNHILQKYGKPYIKDNNRKKLVVYLKYNEKVLVDNQYYFKLTICNTSEKLYIEIYDLENNLLDKPFIEFSTIKNHLDLKLKYLALVMASKRNIFNQNYFRYYEIIIYELKSLQKFISLIEHHVIELEIECRMSNFDSKQRNKGILFKIKKDKLNYLFNEVVRYNSDDKQVIFNSTYYFK